MSRFERGNLDVKYSTVLTIFKVLGQPQKDTGFIIELDETEREYIWLLTALDAMRIAGMPTEGEQDYHYRIRHSVRSKLLDKME